LSVQGKRGDVAPAAAPQHQCPKAYTVPKQRPERPPWATIHSMLIQPSQADVRRFFCSVYAKACAGERLEALETLASL